MTTFFLDTSVAMNDSFLKSPFAEAFLKACAILQHAVVIPEIVLDEIKGNFPKKLTEKSAALSKAAGELGKLIEFHIPKLSIEVAVDEYVEWLDDSIQTHGIVVLPYPNISPKELVKKSYVLKKPFKESGEGHKDYLVWKTITSAIDSGVTSPPFIFLTNNTKDFCETVQNGNNILHSDLAGQIDDAAKVPKIYTSIKGAFDKELSPALDGMELADIPALGVHNIDSMTAEFLLEELPQRSLHGLNGLPFNNEVSISSVGAHHINTVTLKKVGDEVVITVVGAVEIEANGFIEKFNFYNCEGGQSKVFIIDGDWNDHVMLVSSSVDTPFELTIFYSTISQAVTGQEISLLDEIEDEWPYN